MNSQATMRYVPNSVLCRWCGRAAAVILFVSWIVLFITEFSRQGAPSSDTYLQAVALAVVFAGYFVGLWSELVGGTMAILGTIAFVTVCMIVTGLPLRIDLLWFAAPGVCYLLAQHFEHVEKVARSQQ